MNRHNLHHLGFTDTLEARMASKVIYADNGCHEWQGARLPSGYGRVGRGQRGRGVELAHRAMWMLHNGPLQGKQVVRHDCDNPSCCNISHLRVGTQGDNIRDMQRRGRANNPRGELHAHAKLTDAEVATIRALANRLSNDAEVGRRFGVSKQHVRNIRIGLSRAA